MRRALAASITAVCGAAVAAFAAASLGAQQPQTPPPDPAPATAPTSQQQQPPPPRFKTEANFVRVDAYPTKAGLPVMDLQMEDFDILENGARQQVQAFEHVVVSPAGPQSMRVDPGSVRAGEQAAANPRNRVFVFFLDGAHVSFEGRNAIKEPLIRLIDRILGPDDLVAVMTPEMSAGQITFGRKTEVVSDMLRNNFTWGRRHMVGALDERERQYQTCYPLLSQETMVAKLIARRRERVALDALHDLVRYLGGVREERKAIIAVTEGWLLYGPDPSILSLKDGEQIPGKPPVGVDEFGKLRVNPPRRDVPAIGAGSTDQTVCDSERQHLAYIDDDQYFRDLIDLSNRQNASFYPVDPRGLAVFDYPLGPAQPPSLAVDKAHLMQRVEMLRTLADGTDGMAVVNSNDLEKGLKRIADDLTSYYLLGYYSTNAKPDGQYRKITVRVKRPGIDVRARRGYRAATVEELNASRTASAAPVPDSVRTANSAMGSLARIRPDQRFALHAVPLRAPGSTAITAVLVIGELQGPLQEFAGGGTAAIEYSGSATGSATATFNKGERAFLLKIPVQAKEGAVDVRARVTSTAGGAAEVPLTDGAKIDASGNVQPVLFRRGLSTGNRMQPVATFQFSRTDRLHLELPLVADATPGTARMLDRNGQALQVPVQVAEKTDDDGLRWLTADATLSALGAGDYLIETSFTAAGTEQKVLTAIRVTR